MRGIPITSIALVQIQYFLRAAELGSFTKAASVLHVTQSAISKSIASLENLLEIQLFIRKSQRLQLTPAGRHLYDAWAETLTQLEASIEHAYRIQRGYAEHLVIGGHESLYFDWLLLPSLKLYQAANQNIDIRIETGTEAQLTKMLINNELDFIVTVFTDIARNADEPFDYTVLADATPQVGMLPSNPLAQKDSIVFEDLRESNFISLLSHAFPHYADLMRNIRMRFGFSPNITCYVSTINAMPLNLLTDNDVFLCNDYFFDRKDDHFCRKPLEEATSNIVICWNKDEQRSKVLSFIDCLQSTIQDPHALAE